MQSDDIESDSEVDHVEYGAVGHNDPGPALDGSWDTFMKDMTEVAFAWGYEEPPNVVIKSADETVPGVHRAINVSTTGFDSRWFVYGEQSAAVDGHWAAFGSASEGPLWDPWVATSHDEQDTEIGFKAQQQIDETLRNHDELQRELERIEEKSNGTITVGSAGQSNEGLEIFHAVAGKDPTPNVPGGRGIGIPIVLIGQQHADEPTGCESLLLLLEILSLDIDFVDSLLDELTIHVIPRANPDGVEYGESGHRYNVDPDAPAKREEEGIYGAQYGGGIGWDINRYHWHEDEWSESPLSKHRHEQYRENPVPEAKVLVNLIHDIDPLWVADLHNQYHYVNEWDDGEERLPTASLGWPTIDDADSDVVDLGKQLCRGVYDDLPGITKFPGGNSPGVARNSYARHGIPCILVEQCGQTNGFGQLCADTNKIRRGYEIVWSMLKRTAGDSLSDIDPDGAEEIPARGDRYNVSLHPDEREEYLSLLPTHERDEYESLLSSL